MIATTIEQSRHLLELGLDPKTADMSYSEVYFDKDKDGNDEWCWRLNACKFVDIEGIIPAWSLSALLEVIPKECEPDIQKSPISGVYFAYCFADRKAHITDDHGNAIDAAYEMVCWLLTSGWKEKSKNEKGGQDESNVY